jgi:predicted amidophosphoribosyltransferase
MTGGAAIDLSGDACPACGSTAALLEGACADCGLQLE